MSPAGVLDVENAETRFIRLQNTLQKLNETTPATTTSPNFSFLNEGTRSKPQYIRPPTEILSRVQAFLPTLKASNALLSSQDPMHINIEHIPSSSDPYIEMNLGLGLFDVRGSTDVPTFPLSKSPSTSSECSSASTSTSMSDAWDTDDDDESDVEIITSFRPIRPIKPLSRRVVRKMQMAKGIVVIGESNGWEDTGARKVEGK